MLALAIDGFKFCVTDTIGDRTECGARFDRLQLFWVADQNELRSPQCRLFDEERHLFRRHHAGFVKDHDCLVVEMIATVVPA